MPSSCEICAADIKKLCDNIDVNPDRECIKPITLPQFLNRGIFENERETTPKEPLDQTTS